MDSKNSLIVLIFLIILAIFGGVYIAKTGTGKPDVQQQNQVFPTTAPTATIEAEVKGQATSSAKKMEDKLIIVDEKVGTGAEAVTGKQITVNYTGTFTDGKKFDSS